MYFSLRATRPSAGKGPDERRQAGFRADRPGDLRPGFPEDLLRLSAESEGEQLDVVPPGQEIQGFALEVIEIADADGLVLGVALGPVDAEGVERVPHVVDLRGQRRLRALFLKVGDQELAEIIAQVALGGPVDVFEQALGEIAARRLGRGPSVQPGNESGEGGACPSLLRQGRDRRRDQDGCERDRDGERLLRYGNSHVRPPGPGDRE